MTSWGSGLHGIRLHIDWHVEHEQSVSRNRVVTQGSTAVTTTSDEPSIQPRMRNSS